ncbi:L-threonylcarbamoyladenylate synthase [Roseomonas sp. USHLN139]|uniref:L-threonylcarbamoyladenylate synthase n=1 Tax=Roseomonas sp. USHLN139 TaxID=3081298 RepID=UPI003B029135
MTERLAADQVERAAELLRAGRLVAFPTETVYGLGGASRDAAAVAGIFAAKGRPRFNPLISHFPDAESAFAEAVADERAHALARAFWPGPLTLVLPRAPDSRIALLASAGLPSLALRVPAHPLARALLRAVGQPVAAPSANRSGGVSPTTAEHVLDGLSGRIDAVLDGGPCAVGLESTVLDLTGPEPRLLRPGGIAEAELEKILGPIGRAAPAAAEDEARPAPGMLTSHYAPGLPVRLEAASVASSEALLAFGRPLPGAGAIWQLSESGDLVQAAARLFAGLRALDALGQRLGLTAIAVQPVPMEGLGAAINDRLSRAAAPRG